MITVSILLIAAIVLAPRFGRDSRPDVNKVSRNSIV
jgi:hypothetical protein